MESRPLDKRLSPKLMGKLGPCDHLLQIYGNDERLIEVLEWFVGQGLQDDGAVIVIATPRHVHDLEMRLRKWVPIDQARWQGRYIPLLANEVLEKVLVNDWPDERRFTLLMDKHIAQARAGLRPVRLFGEMVSLLLERSAKAATVRLEQIWTAYCNREALPLLCAYPEAVFTRGAIESMNEIAGQHTRVLSQEA
jgi:hypothetical protein